MSPNVSTELIDSKTYSEFAPFIRPGERPLLVTVDLWTAHHDTEHAGWTPVFTTEPINEEQ